jgi:predicted nucleic acid-binding protein
MSASYARAASVIFDTDVLIWTLRGNEKAAKVVEDDRDRAISIVSFMELLQGARDKEEVATIRRLLLDFETVPLSEEIGYRGSLYMEQFALRVAMTPLDALIAATAVERQLTLCTGNAKHFRQVPDLDVKVFRPVKP